MFKLNYQQTTKSMQITQQAKSINPPGPVLVSTHGKATKSSFTAMHFGGELR